MRRVVVTGIGIVSSIGNNKEEVLNSLRNGISGISFADDYAENGFRSQVHGDPKIELAEFIDKRQLRFMGDGAAYNYISMEQAIKDSGLEDKEVSNEKNILFEEYYKFNFFSAFIQFSSKFRQKLLILSWQITQHYAKNKL